MSDIWPDPAEWAQRLSAKLVSLDLQYYGFNAIRRMTLDPDATANPQVFEGDPQADATLAAAGALSAVVAALREIPTFGGNVGLQAISDLAASLIDLDRGLRPALLQPRRGPVTTTDHSGRRRLKATAVLCVELLELAGYPPTSAQKAVANILTDAGFTGRKRAKNGEGLSWKSVNQWCADLAAHGADPDGRKIVDRAIDDWKAKRSWPPTADQVLAFARLRAEDPALRTTI